MLGLKVFLSEDVHLLLVKVEHEENYCLVGVSSTCHAINRGDTENYFAHYVILFRSMPSVVNVIISTLFIPSS